MKHAKLTGRKSYVTAAVITAIGVGLPFLRLSCGPQHETIVKIMPAEKPCPCLNIPVIDTVRHPGKAVDTLIGTPRCKDTTTPKPPVTTQPCGPHSHHVKGDGCGCDQGYHKAKTGCAKDTIVDQPKPCPTCPDAIEKAHSQGAQMRKVVTRAISNNANAIKDKFGDGSAVEVIFTYNVSQDGVVANVAYTVMKGSENRTSRGNLASLIGVNVIGTEVGVPGGCCTRTDIILVP